MSGLGSPIRDSRSNGGGSAFTSANDTRQKGPGSRGGVRTGSGGARSARPLTREELVNEFKLRTMSNTATTAAASSSEAASDVVSPTKVIVEGKEWVPPVGPKAPYLTPFRPAFNGEILVLENYGLGIDGGCSCQRPEFQPNNPSFTSAPLPLLCRVASARRSKTVNGGTVGGAQEHLQATGATGSERNEEHSRWHLGSPRPITADTAGSAVSTLNSLAGAGRRAGDGNEIVSYLVGPRSAKSRFPRPPDQDGYGSPAPTQPPAELLSLGAALGGSPRPWIDFARLKIARDVHCEFLVERIACMSQDFYDALRAAYYAKFPSSRPPGREATPQLVGSPVAVGREFSAPLAENNVQHGDDETDDLSLLLYDKKLKQSGAAVVGTTTNSTSPAPKLLQSSLTGPLASQLYSDSRNSTHHTEDAGGSAASRTITAMSDLMMAHQHSEAGDDRASSVDTGTHTLLAQFGRVSVGAGHLAADASGAVDEKAVGRKALQHELDSFRLKTLGGSGQPGVESSVPTQAVRKLSMTGGEGANVAALKREIEALEADVNARLRRQKAAREKAAKEEAAKKATQDQQEQGKSGAAAPTMRSRANRMKELQMKQQEARRLSAAAVTADISIALSQVAQRQQQAQDPLLGGDPALEELAVSVRDNLRFWQKHTYLLRQRASNLSVKAKRTVFSTEKDATLLGQPQRPAKPPNQTTTPTPTPAAAASVGKKSMLSQAVAPVNPPELQGLFQPLLLSFEPCEICPEAQPLHKAIHEAMEHLKAVVEETKILNKRVAIMQSGSDKDKNALLKELGIAVPVTKTPVSLRTVTPSRKGLAQRDSPPKKRVASKKKAETPIQLLYQDVGLQCTLETELTLYAFYRVDSIARKEIAARQLVRTMQVAMSNITQFWDDIEADLSCYRCCTIPKEAMILSPCGTTCCRSCLTDDDDAAVNLHYLRDCDYPSHDGWISNVPVRKLVVAANTFREGKMESVIPEIAYAVGNLCTSINVDPSTVDLARLVKGQNSTVPTDEATGVMTLEKDVSAVVASLSSGGYNYSSTRSSVATKGDADHSKTRNEDDDVDDTSYGTVQELEEKALSIRRGDLAALLLAPGSPFLQDDLEAMKKREQIIQSIQCFVR